MTNFHKTILKAISDYKLIVRKTLSPKKCSDKLHELGVKRKYIKDIDEVGLYEIGLKIIEELKQYTSSYSSRRTANSYLGAEEFLRYLENLFAEYEIENGKVVHVGQKSSCALLAAIQLVAMPKEKVTTDILQKIKQYGEVVARYGNQEQKKMLVDAVSSTEESLAGYFNELV